MTAQYSEEMLTNAIQNLERLNEFGAADILPQILQRLEAGSRQGPEASSEPFDPLLASWPEPEMLHHVVDRLNQWIRTQPPAPDWKPDRMASSLPEPLATLPEMKTLGRTEFSRLDGYVLQETVWLRDIALWARGDFLDDLERAISLFDWTVRNVQLEAEQPDRIPQFPWETLLFGRGTAEERAWVFILLLRQSNIDAAVLAFGEGDTAGKDGGKSEGGKSPPGLQSRDKGLCVGVLVEKNVYLFDPLLGLPIPAPDGVTLEKNGLSIRPATLAQCAGDKALLRRMDVDESRTYGVKAADMARTTAFLEASPSELSLRMRLLESRLAGGQKMTLAVSPTASAERWKAKTGVAAARLWTRPFETLARREHLAKRESLGRLAAMLPFYAVPSAPLYQGRMLYFRGKFVGENGAMQYYLQARPSNAELRASSADPAEKLMYMFGKQNASYWCGLIAYQRGNYADAVDYFSKRTLQADPNGPWTIGAQYNLARTYEASGETERAILQYGSNAASPGYHGDLLRAKWLRELDAKKQ